ncbi:hypothetical protein KSP39_PZI011141 [Platanthera zijinensis]|uniref:K Homology domain-containing protein n=1 Tax=Platanthera zijinensis TaxID=2320716 RepID=A0AAP0BI15_9ASPA
MGDDLHYSSRPDNKRKFDSQGVPPSAAGPGPGRRTSGFSAPIASPSPSGAAIPPDEIQLAKQRAQEIAAKIFSDAEAKRPRVENGGPADDSSNKGFDFDQPRNPFGQPSASQTGMTSQSSFPSYGYPGLSKKIDVPNGRVGVIIGKSGETIKYLQVQSGARIQVTRDMDADPNSQSRPVELVGTPEQISKAEQLINDVLAEAEVGGSGIISSWKFTSVPTAEHFLMKVPSNKIGLIIGKGGETIKNMQASTGARIQKRPRNPQTGGYRPPRPPASWDPTMQQAGYGYMQPVAYPGQPPQYSMPQPAYGWDQSTNPATQQSTQVTSYDYYSQQQQPQQQQTIAGSSAPADSSTYNNTQIPPTYTAQGSYANPTYSEPATGQQQGYGQSGSYAQSVPQTGYAQQAPPPAQPGTGYGNQSGYAQPPPAQKPPPAQPVYSQQPTTSYAQPTQAYGQTAQVYSQPAFTSATTYTPGAYGQGYGQQQPHGDSYSGAYGQPSYSSDGARGTYEAGSAAQAAPSGATKALPKS